MPINQIIFCIIVWYLFVIISLTYGHYLGSRNLGILTVGYNDSHNISVIRDFSSEIHAPNGE
jgi:hypothetical protein